MTTVCPRHALLQTWIRGGLASLLAAGLLACVDDVEAVEPSADTDVGTSSSGDETDDESATGTPSASTGGFDETGEPDPDPEPDLPPVAVCGDGIVEGIELCDDGNDVLGDRCRPDCTTPLVDGWTRYATGAARDIAVDALVDDDGTLYVLGMHESLGGYDLWVRGYGDDGGETWHFTYGGALSALDEGLALAWHPSGDLLITGYETTANDRDALVMRVATGATEATWIDLYDGPADAGAELANDIAFDIATDAEGNIVVVGSHRSVGQQVWLRSYTADGDVRWNTEFRDDRFENMGAASAVVVNANGTLVVAGVTADGQETFGWLLSVGEGGEVIDFDTVDLVPNAMALAPDGNLLLAGSKETAPGFFDLAVVHQTLAGEVLAQVEVDGGTANADFARDVVVTDDGAIYVAGSSSVPGNQYDAWLLGFDAQLELQWSRRYNGDAGLQDEALGVGVSPDGETVVFTGYESVSGQAFDAWVRTFATPDAVL